jgi:hypothetical protein
MLLTTRDEKLSSDVIIPLGKESEEYSKVTEGED